MGIMGGAGVVLESGLVVAFGGLIVDIPAGYVICDGNNGTQNMLNRSWRSVVNAATDAGATGGAFGKTTAGHIHTLSFPNDTAGDFTEDAGGGRVVQGGFGGVPANAYLKEDTQSQTDSIADIRSPYIDMIPLMKT
jgi:hypothetical protein